MAHSTDQLLEAQVRDWMQRLGVPGVAVGLIHHDREHCAGFGVTNVEHPLPVDADTIFLIMSITKTFTGMAVMRLAERGDLDLDIPLRTYIPDFRLGDEATAARATLRHVLTHTGGWAGQMGAHTEACGSGDDALAKIVARMEVLPQLTPPGELWAYNDAGFHLAGRAIEVATGRTYETAVQELVLEPLEMHRSFFFASDAVTHRVAAGHVVVDGRPGVVRPWALPRATNPVGGLGSTLHDMLRYARFHLGGGTTVGGRRLLSAISMQHMQTPSVKAGGPVDAVALPWMIREWTGGRVVGHWGMARGQHTALWMVPEKQFACVVLTNADPGERLHDEVTRWMLRQYVGVSEPDSPWPDRSQISLADYTGRYVVPGLPVELRLSVDDGYLTLQVIRVAPAVGVAASVPPPAARLAFRAEDRVVGLDGAWTGRRGEFLRDADGQVVWFRIYERLWRREPLSAPA